MDLGLKGKRAIISGASKGIGLAIAETLVAEGASVGICARGADLLGVVADKLRGQGAPVVFDRALDVSDGGAIAEFVDAAADAMGGLDIVVVNASASTGKDPGAWQRSFDVDLMSLVLFIEASTPKLAAAGGGAVVSISTTSAIEAGMLTTTNSYAALKAAGMQHAAAQARALGPQGIRVNVVSPGPIWFEGSGWERIKEQQPERYENALATEALGKLGTPQDVANAVAFLASPAAGHITGTNLVVDGGFINRFQF